MKSVHLHLTFLFVSLFLIQETPAQRPDLIGADIYRAGTLEQGRGNKLEAMIANNGRLADTRRSYGYASACGSHSQRSTGPLPTGSFAHVLRLD